MNANNLGVSFKVWFPGTRSYRELLIGSDVNVPPRFLTDGAAFGQHIIKSWILLMITGPVCGLRAHAFLPDIFVRPRGRRRPHASLQDAIAGARARASMAWYTSPGR